MNYPKLYYTKPRFWDDSDATLPCFLLITNDYYQIFWVNRFREFKFHFDFISTKFNQEFKIIDSYRIKHGEVSRREFYRRDRRRIKYILDQLNEAEELNPKQYLTHENPYLRKVITDAQIV